MLTNLTTLIIYLFSIENNIKIPLIIPILLIIRCVIMLLFKKNVIYKLTVLQIPILSNIEYIISIILSLCYIYFLNIDKTNIQDILKSLIFYVFIIYVILLIINFLWVCKLI
jgi:hypothetical protein